MKMKTKSRSTKLRVNVAVSTPLSRTSVVARDHAHLSSDEIRFRIDVKREEAKRLEESIASGNSAIVMQRRMIQDKEAHLVVVQTDIDAMEAVIEARR